MPRCKLEFSQVFRDQLREIKAYLLQHRDRIDTVERILRHITARVAQLKDFPELGAQFEPLTTFRHIIVEEYIIFYTYVQRAKLVRIEFIFHGTENWLVLAKKDRVSL